MAYETSLHQGRFTRWSLCGNRQQIRKLVEKLTQAYLVLSRLTDLTVLVIYCRLATI